MDIRIRWGVSLRNKLPWPRAYYFSNGKVRKQLSMEEMRFHVSTGNIVDEKVVEWVKARTPEALAKTEQLSTASEATKVLQEDATKGNEGFAPNSRELYDYLDSLYGKVILPIGGGSYADVIDKSSRAIRISDY